jgi:hypothetical protein
MSGLAGLSPADANDGARLMGVLMSLAGEVFVLKAEVQRLRLALREAGAVDDAALQVAGASPAMAAWMADEEAAFGRALLRPFTHPDEAPDVSARMTQR